MEEVDRLREHLRALIDEAKHAFGQEARDIALESGRTGLHSGLSLRYERAARELVDKTVPRFMEASALAVERRLEQRSIEMLIDGAVNELINVIVFQAQSGGPGAPKYGARPEVIAQEKERALQLVARYRSGYLRTDAAASGAQNLVVDARGAQGFNIAQGGRDVSQTSSFTFSLDIARSELAVLIEEIDKDPSLAREADLQADLQALRLQLDKRDPDQGILRGLGRSARGVLEGALAGMLSTAGTAAAVRLWQALGLGTG